MLASVFTKTLRDRAIASLALGLLLAFFVAFVFWFWDSLGLEGAFADMPEVLTDVVAGGTELPPEAGGYATGEMFNLLAPVAVLGFAISFGAGAIAGEERDKTLDLLLANPVSRTWVALSKAAVLVITVLVIGLMLWGGATVAAGVNDLALSASDTGAAVVHLVAFGLAFGLFAFALGAWTGNVAVAAGAAGGVAVASYLGTSALPLIDQLAELAQYTPWYLYNGNAPLLNGVHVGQVVALSAAAVLFLALATVGLNRRDLRG